MKLKTTIAVVGADTFTSVSFEEMLKHPGVYEFAKEQPTALAQSPWATFVSMGGRSLITDNCSQGSFWDAMSGTEDVFREYRYVPSIRKVTFENQ